MTKLVERHSSSEVSGASLLISGLILTAILILCPSSTLYPGVRDWIFLALFSLVPLAGCTAICGRAQQDRRLR